jgi:uncharacterized protein (TIGR02246 family)
MSKADEVVQSVCQRYSATVNASDSHAYGELFAVDAIRMPPGALPEHGRAQIQQGEQADYDVAKWNVTISPHDALSITEDWVYGIGDVEVEIVPHAGGATSDVALTVTWLLERQPSGDWLIKRQMWNRKPE